ncbi:MAG: cell division protein FtsQ/DivIB [Eubacterium sp.]
MKKKEKKKSEKIPHRPEAERNDLRDLNSQLGSFGLEPPKIYRNDQAVKRYSDLSENDKKSGRRNVDNKHTKRSSVGSAKNYQSVDEKRKAQNKKRKNKNKFRKLIYIILVLIGIAAVLSILSLTVLFKIDTITIKGNNIYSTKEISAVIPIEKEKNLFLADTDGAAQKLEENLPYIYNAEIKRKFPSTIVVNITETKTVYSIKNKDKTYTLLDDNFKVLEVSAAEKPSDSIEIKKLALESAQAGMTAEVSNEQTKKDLLILTSAVKSLKLEDEITAIYSNDINNNYMVYDGRITYKLGTTENIEKKIYSALTATEKLAESNPGIEGEMSITDDKQVYFTEK